jgi:hypothetical protein
MLVTPPVQVALWLLLTPGPREESPNVLLLLQGQAVMACGFGIIAAMLGMLIWPVTRRVIAATASGSWQMALRFLYAGAIGAACGLFMVCHLPIMLPGRVPFRPPTGSLHVLAPPTVTALIWAAWYMLIEYVACRGSSDQPGNS